MSTSHRAARAEDADALLDAALDARERRELARVDSPPAIQAWLDGVGYSDELIYRCPFRVVRDRRGHCYDGAVFAAAMLRRLGHPPLLVDMLPNERDDDHVLAVFRVDRCWGAVAKSNFVGLRYREPVYRTLRELVMSYFEVHFNVAAEKTLRGYTVPVDLSRSDHLRWTVDSAAMDVIAERLDSTRRYRLLTPAQEARLAPVYERSMKAGMMGANQAGLWRPRKA